MNIYVGNLDYQTTEEQLRQHFEAFGDVSSVKLINDKMTGRSKGFAFVEMPQDDQGQTAIDRLNGSVLGRRNISVNEARPVTENKFRKPFNSNNNRREY